MTGPYSEGCLDRMKAQEAAADTACASGSPTEWWKRYQRCEIEIPRSSRQFRLCPPTLSLLGNPTSYRLLAEDETEEGTPDQGGCPRSQSHPKPLSFWIGR